MCIVLWFGAMEQLQKAYARVVRNLSNVGSISAWLE
jgi:hypothetical protein